LDYIRTARSKGIAERTVLVKHGFRAAMSPIVTILGLDIAALLTGTLITEQIFGVDGIGATHSGSLPRPGPARHHG
jgi:peptide/nickel transport system permease protein